MEPVVVKRAQWQQGWDFVLVTRGEPSEAAWRRMGDVAARILENIAERDIREAARRLQQADSRSKAEDRELWGGSNGDAFTPRFERGASGITPDSAGSQEG